MQYNDIFWKGWRKEGERSRGGRKETITDGMKDWMKQMSCCTVWETGHPGGPCSPTLFGKAPKKTNIGQNDINALTGLLQTRNHQLWFYTHHLLPGQAAILVLFLSVMGLCAATTAGWHHGDNVGSSKFGSKQTGWLWNNPCMMSHEKLLKTFMHNTVHG